MWVWPVWPAYRAACTVASPSTTLRKPNWASRVHHRSMVGSLDVEVVVLQGMDDLVHEGVLVVRAKLSHPYAVIFGDDIGDVLSV